MLLDNLQTLAKYLTFAKSFVLIKTKSWSSPFRLSLASVRPPPGYPFRPLPSRYTCLPDGKLSTGGMDLENHMVVGNCCIAVGRWCIAVGCWCIAVGHSRTAVGCCCMAEDYSHTEIDCCYMAVDYIHTVVGY